MQFIRLCWSPNFLAAQDVFSDASSSSEGAEHNGRCEMVIKGGHGWFWDISVYLRNPLPVEELARYFSQCVHHAECYPILHSTRVSFIINFHYVCNMRVRYSGQYFASNFTEPVQRSLRICSFDSSLYFVEEEQKTNITLWYDSLDVPPRVWSLVALYSIFREIMGVVFIR